MAEILPYEAYTHTSREKIGGRGFTPGGGDGIGGGMEARVAALEGKLDRIDAKLDVLVKDVSYLKGKVDSMPTTLQLGGFILAVLAIAGLAKYLAP